MSDQDVAYWRKQAQECQCEVDRLRQDVENLKAEVGLYEAMKGGAMQRIGQLEQECCVKGQQLSRLAEAARPLLRYLPPSGPGETWAFVHSACMAAALAGQLRRLTQVLAEIEAGGQGQAHCQEE